MKQWNWRRFFTALLIASAALCMNAGCDGGEKVLDEVTGNRAVKQYHRSKKDLEKIADQQTEKYGSIPGDDKEDSEKE
ncbi:MAG: hypothetical protein PVG99_02975 [Desulfobacteraceae bacterium]